MKSEDLYRALGAVWNIAFEENAPRTREAIDALQRQIVAERTEALMRPPSPRAVMLRSLRKSIRQLQRRK